MGVPQNTFFPVSSSVSTTFFSHFFWGKQCISIVLLGPGKMAFLTCFSSTPYVILFLVLHIYVSHKQIVLLAMQGPSIDEVCVFVSHLLSSGVVTHHVQVLKNIVETAKTCEMKVPAGANAVRFGRAGFDKIVLDTVKEVSETCNTSKDTRALVVSCASGVGRTYATQTVRWGCQQRTEAKGFEVVSAYLGFSSLSRITWGEEYCMKGGGSVEAVVLCRLLMWLTRLCECDSISELDSEGTAVQQQVVMPRVTKKATLSVLGRGIDALRQSVTECLMNLAKKVRDEEGKKLVVIAVVDKGQFLDEFVPREDGKKVGARLALRCLRELQLAVHDNLVLLPICTGIDSAVSLASKTEGENRVLDKEEQVIMLHNEWLEFCGVMDRKSLRLTKQQFQWFAALAWPRARGFLRMHVQKKYSVPSRAGVLWEERDARKVLKAAADKQTLPISDVPANMVRLGDEDKTRPILDFGSLGDLMDQIELDPTTFRLPESVSLKDLRNGKWSTFEKVVFNSLAMFAGLFYHRQPDPDTYLPSEPSTGVLRTWMPEGTANFVSVDTLEHPKEHLHPLNKEKTALSEDFEDQLSMLTAEGDAVLLHCGGDAPLDFILMKAVEVVEVVEVINVEEMEVDFKVTRTIAVRFADAQHTDEDDTTVTKESLERERDEMMQKALEVHKSIECYAEVKLEPFKDDHCLLVTNKRVEEGKGQMKCILNPNTTEWLPMTQVLFGPSQLPSSSLLRSRPMWPAFSQLSEIPRHTWSTRLPQTGARMMRYAPVLRRLCKLI